MRKYSQFIRYTFRNIHHFRIDRISAIQYMLRSIPLKVVHRFCLVFFFCGFCITFSFALGNSHFMWINISYEKRCAWFCRHFTTKFDTDRLLFWWWCAFFSKSSAHQMCYRIEKPKWKITKTKPLHTLCSLE